MEKLTVILVRNAESEFEARDGRPPVLLGDCSNAAVAADFSVYINDHKGDEQGRDDGKLTLSVRVDPELTANGFEQAQTCMTALLEALGTSTTTSKRNIALFSAPLRTCTSTAVMVSCAGLSNYDEQLNFRMSTREAAVAPAAVPILIHDGLCNGDPQIERLAGWKCVVDAGLLHCAALPFNDARPNAPIMKVFERMKIKTKDRLVAWGKELAEDGTKLHTCTAVQFLRQEKQNDPWSLTEMTEKVNLVVDMVEPKKYMLTPRTGVTNPKNHYKEWEETAEPYIKESVFSARQAGCDTVILVVPGEALKAVVSAAGGACVPGPCCIASLVATVGDNLSEPITWSLHKVTSNIASDGASAIPPHGGTVLALCAPPQGKVPDSANAPGKNKWAQFPAPEPEVVPPDYPDCPDFGSILDEDIQDFRDLNGLGSKPKNETKPKTGKKKSKPQ